MPGQVPLLTPVSVHHEHIPLGPSAAVRPGDLEPPLLRDTAKTRVNGSRRRSAERTSQTNKRHKAKSAPTLDSIDGHRLPPERPRPCASYAFVTRRTREREPCCLAQCALVKMGCPWLSDR